MYHSYVMGLGNAIEGLKDEGFEVKSYGNDYGVSFPKEKALLWEEFIKDNLKLNYWNEYLADEKVVFLFHLDGGIKRYEVMNYSNDEVLLLCEKLFGGRFTSIRDMLKSN